MSAVSKKKSDKKDKIILNIQRTLCYIVLIIISILCLFSFYVLLINTTRSHPDIQKGFSLIPGKSFFVNLTNLLKDKQLPVLKGMCNSLLVASGSAVLSVYFSALTAYAIHAYDFRFKKAAFTFIMVIMMVPTQVSALGFINQMSNMRLMNSFIPLIIPSIASPVVFFFIKQYMDSVLPMELIEAARIDGANQFQIYWKIFMPIMKPSLILVGVLNMLTVWNDYLGPLIFLQDRSKYTLALGLASFKGVHSTQIIPMLCITIIMIIPPIIIFIIAQKYIVEGTSGSIK